MEVKPIQRPTYLERALMFRDTDLVKAVKGVRRQPSEVGRRATGSYPPDVDGIRIVLVADFFLG